MNSISLNNCEANAPSDATLIIKSLLLAIAQKVSTSLADIADSVRSKEVSLDSNEFKKLFLQSTTKQIEESFDNFVRNHKINQMKFETSTRSKDPKTEESIDANNDTNANKYTPENFMDNFRSELAKLPVKKVKAFSQRKPDHDLLQTPTIGVFGVGHRCHICFKPFQSRKYLLLHREESKHHFELAECMLATPENRRPLPPFELSPYDSDNEQLQRPAFSENRTKSLKCKFCPREFTQKTFLTKHEAKHQAQNDTMINVRVLNKAKGSSLKCSVCSKQFLNKVMLVKHRQIHAKRT